MTRRAQLPTEADVRDARDALLVETAANGTRPAVVALAGRVGLSNTTFWRHFPHIAHELADARRQQPTAADPTAAPDATPGSATAATADQLATIRRDNAGLRE